MAEMDFHAAIETFAEAWVAANTQTAVNPEPTQQSHQPSQENIPSTLPTEEKKENVTSCSPSQPPESPSPKQPQTASTSGKSIPVHCLIETTATAQGFESGGGTNVELDSYAIVPNSTLFSEIVRTALIKLGYSPSEAIGAKGAIQIKNWKPLMFDMITDNPEVTVEDILGDLTPVATMRIKLCSQRKTTTTNDLKDKLLQVLLAQSRGILQGSGCPIEKEVMTMIAKGETDHIDADKRKAFDRWHQEQLDKVKASIKVENQAAEREEKNATPTTSPPAREQENTRPVPNTSGHKTRFRTSFDPDLEIPRLHQWFQENKHPTRDKMVQFLNELNSLESRQGRKPLDLTNIIYWFKNARAAQRRASRSMELPLDESHLLDNDMNDDNSSDHHSTTDEHIPVLPNKNAVYVVNPLHHDGQSPNRFQNGVPYNDQAVDMTSQGQGHHQGNLRYSSSSERNDEAIDMSTSSRNEREATSSISDKSDENSEKKSSCRSSDEEMSDFEDDPGGVIKHERDEAYLDHVDHPMRPLPTSLPSNSHMALHNSLTSPHTPAQVHMMSAAMNYRLGSLGHLGRNPTALSQHPFYSVMSPSMLEERRKRTRVFIDPLSEIPKLEKWFIEDTHPTAYMIEKYCDELNRSEYRQRFPKLEPKNVQLWFKNHRAKVKRARLEGESKTMIKSENMENEPLLNHDMYRNSQTANPHSQEILGGSYATQCN